MDLASHAFDTVMAPLEASGLRERREELVRRAGGRVLEVGAGTGANLPHYDEDGVNEITISDVVLRPAIFFRASQWVTATRYRRTAVEDLPFAGEYFDAVVSTLVFCSVRDPVEGLSQVHRVLKPGGKFYFIEHILPEHGFARPLFHAITPMWKRIAGGCHLNRQTVQTIRDTGFLIEEMHYFGNGAFVHGVAEKPQNGAVLP
ncbi:MAG: methyltransferase domain-containing protein [Spirochaetes bacterium]|jgi:ubiquinone/menaquinone biosynthesis C-methylase UbiE|nr:methyltransferase domain-containing protein [Spirochaetota bacterium]